MRREPVNSLEAGSRWWGPVLLCFTVLLANEAQADTCRLSLSQPRVDYGVIHRTERIEGASGRQSLGKRTLHLNVVCTDPSVMALRFNGMPADGHGFQFGRQGRFTLSLKQTQVDGRDIEWAVAQLPSEPASGRLLPGQTLVARASGTRVTGRRLTAQVEIDVDLPSAALAVRNETLLEGLGGFELVSLAVPPSR
ncbi:hypothetical protein [Pseudomonas fluorescens]|uniref:hypothetical protein n=1 Tax=Pseudomonas fluorescens TaxID=294 RepID=UPI002035B028|nr:hypothetical protein [Pseudomonas fluorescens]